MKPKKTTMTNCHTGGLCVGVNGVIGFTRGFPLSGAVSPHRSLVATIFDIELFCLVVSSCLLRRWPSQPRSQLPHASSVCNRYQYRDILLLKPEKISVANEW